MPPAVLYRFLIKVFGRHRFFRHIPIGIDFLHPSQLIAALQFFADAALLCRFHRQIPNALADVLVLREQVFLRIFLEQQEVYLSGSCSLSMASSFLPYRPIQPNSFVFISFSSVLVLFQKRRDKQQIRTHRPQASGSDLFQLAPQVRLELTTLRLTVLEIQNPEKSRNAGKTKKSLYFRHFFDLHDGTDWTNRTVKNTQKYPKYSKEYSKFSNRKRPPYLVFRIMKSEKR